LQIIDYFILLFIFAQIVSLIGAVNKVLGIFDVIYHIKHALIYFFITHKVKRYHLRMIIIILLFAILFESSIALYERLTGNVGIGVSKGAILELGEQPKVAGIEEIRAAGTTTDSHALGLYYVLLLPVPFVMLQIRYLKPLVKFLLFCITIIGIMGLVVTFTRSGWLSFSISSIFAMGIIVFSWKQGRFFLIFFVIFLAVSVLNPKAIHYIYDRFAEAPSELLETRFDQYRTALGVWGQNILFGCGTANFKHALDDPKSRIFGSIEAYFLHNTYLTIAAETGLVGLISFYGIIFFAIIRCWKVLKCEDLLIRGLALSIITALLGFLLDGLTGPMFKQPVPFAQLWIFIGLAMSFGRLLKEQVEIIL
jgi:O-antigen ligase